jgi:hypothetical protein
LVVVLGYFGFDLMQDFLVDNVFSLVCCDLLQFSHIPFVLRYHVLLLPYVSLQFVEDQIIVFVFADVFYLGLDTRALFLAKTLLQFAIRFQTNIL